MAACRCTSVSCTVTTRPLPVEDTVAPSSDVPPVVTAPSATCMPDWTTSESDAFTVSPKVSSNMPVPSSRAADESSGFMVSGVTAAAELAAPLPLPRVSWTASATAWTVGVPMATTLCRSASPSVPLTETADEGTASRTSVAGSYAPAPSRTYTEVPEAVPAETVSENRTVYSPVPSFISGLVVWPASRAGSTESVVTAMSASEIWDPRAVPDVSCTAPAPK